MESERSDRGCKEVHLLITPLQCYYRNHFDKVDFAAARSENHRVPFRRLQHWAIQVGDDVDGTIFEVTSFNSTDGKRDLRISSSKAWRKSRMGRPRVKLLITVTSHSSPYLETVADCIWRAMFEQEYRSFSRNCQSFVEIFTEIIEDRNLLDEERRSEIVDMPSSFNPFYVLLHLKQAKSAAIRWSRKAFNRNGASSGSDMEEMRHTHEQVRLPTRRSKRWLELVNEVSDQHEINETKDFLNVVAKANDIHRAEILHPNKAARRCTWGC